MQSLSADTGVESIGGDGAAWGVAYCDRARSLAPTALNRSIQVVAVATLDEVVAQVQAHRPFLQSAGLAVAPGQLYRLSDLLGAAGVTRISAIGSMTSPEAGWHHDGRFNLLDLVRMVEIEQSAELAADRIAPYAE